MRLGSLLAYFLLVLSSGIGVLAQTEKAVCHPLPRLQWNLNSLNQDPCTVGSILDATCRNQTDYAYLKLEKNQTYPPPNTGSVGDFVCSCNTVIYNLRMACTTCQEAEQYGWSEWAVACPSEMIFMLQYPREIPQGTRIPHWALSGDSWIADDLYVDESARFAGRNPEAGPRGSGTPRGHSNTGAIIGGVVGGVIALAVITLCFVSRPSRNNRDENPRPKPRFRSSFQHPADSQRESVFTYDPSASGGPTLALNLPPEPHQPESPSTSLPPGSTPQTNAGPSTSPPPLNTRQTSTGLSTSPSPRSTRQTGSDPSTSPPLEENVETNAPPLTPPPAYTPLCED